MRQAIPGLNVQSTVAHPWRARSAAICIPVRNEEALLPASLSALAALKVEPWLAVNFCFMLDGCIDRSEALIAAFANQSPHRVFTAASVDAGASNAGKARAAAMTLGRRASGGQTNTALLTTDADTLPANDWVIRSCRALRTSDVVAGRIVREDQGTTPLQDGLELYYDRLYALRRSLDPVPWESPFAHHHVGGASLAFRAEAYAAVGGFRPLASAEDATIVDDAHRMGLRVRRDRDVVVTTSARHHGRAVNGLADHLRAMAEDPAPIRVAHPERAIWQYRGHAIARASFGRLHEPGVVEELSAQLRMPADHFQRIAAGACNAEAFATLAVPEAPGTERLISLAEAEQAIARLEQMRYDRAA